jgi:hypothetical protein
MDKKMWCLYMAECYSAIKKNEILSFTDKWVELENIILSDVSQAQTDKSHIFSLICGRKIQKISVYTNTSMVTHTHIMFSVVEMFEEKKERNRE